MPRLPPYTFESRSSSKDEQNNGTFDKKRSTARQDEDGKSLNVCLQQENQLLESENLAFRRRILLMMENSDLRFMDVFATLMTMRDEKLQRFISEKCGIHPFSDPAVPLVSSDDDNNCSISSCDNSYEHVLPSPLNEQRSNNTQNYRHRTSCLSPDKTSSHLHGRRNQSDLYTADNRSSSADESPRANTMSRKTHFFDTDDTEKGKVPQSVSFNNRTPSYEHVTDNQTAFNPIQERITMKGSPKETPQHICDPKNKTKHGCHECMNLMKCLPNDFQSHASVKIGGVFDKKSQASCPVFPSDGDMKKLHIDSDRFHKCNPVFISTTTKQVKQSSQTQPKITGSHQCCEQRGGKFIGSESLEEYVGTGYCLHCDCRCPVNSTDEGYMSNTYDVQLSLQSESGNNGSAISQEEQKTFPNVQSHGRNELEKMILSRDNQSTNRVDKGSSSSTNTAIPGNASHVRHVRKDKQIDKSGSSTFSKNQRVDAKESSYAPQRHSCTDSYYRPPPLDRHFDQMVANVGASDGDQMLHNYRAKSVSQKPILKDQRKNPNVEVRLGNPVAPNKPMQAQMEANSMKSEGDVADEEEHNESLADMMAIEGDNLSVREQKALFVFHRPVDTLTGYQPKVTAVLKSFIAQQHPNKRLVGEIAFQLDRRILDFVFRDLCEKNRGTRCPRYYGYSVANISQLIAKEARLSDEEPRLEMMLHDKLIQLTQLLSHFGYNFEKHAEFTQEMVNSYGLLFNGIPENDKVSALNQPAALRIMLGKILKDEDELYNMLILLDCLCYLAFHDKRPLFV